MLAILSSDATFDLVKLGFWALFLFGLVSAVISTLLRIRKFRESANWPIADGKITGPGEIKLTSMERTGAYDAHVTYEYMVAGANYRATQRLTSFSRREEAEQFLRDHLPEGASVRVHYKPDHPATSRLAFNPYDPDGKSKGNADVQIQISR